MRVRGGAGLRRYVDRALLEIDTEGDTQIEGEGEVVEKVVSIAELVKRSFQGEDAAKTLEQTTSLTRAADGAKPRLVIRLACKDNMQQPQP